MKIAILASHNGSGLDAIYRAIQESKLPLHIALVISNNPDAKVLQKASTYNIESSIVNIKRYTDPDKKIFELLKERQCEVVFLAGYMKKISKELTQNFQIINSHPALLPKFGGAGMYGRYVHEAVIAAKEKESGVTIHRVNELYDDGEIILQKKLQLQENETVLSLEKRVKELEQSAIVEGLQKCLKLQNT